MGKEHGLAKLPWSEYQNREARRGQAGRRIADHLRSQPNPTLLLDMDGVVMQGDGFYRPTVATLGIIPVLRKLEEAGVKIGLNTSRGDQIVDFLRDNGLQVEGPRILESGQKITIGDTTESLSHPNLPNFIAEIEKKVEEHPESAATWPHVLRGEGKLCSGSPQWKGSRSMFVWFDTDYARETDAIGQFQTMFKQLAVEHGLDFDKDVATSSFDMLPDERRGNITMLKVSGAINGKAINKVTPVDRLPDPWVFIADGPGDPPFAEATKNRGGFVVGIEGSIDRTSEIVDFLNMADLTLQSPFELARVLRYTANILLEKTATH